MSKKIGCIAALAMAVLCMTLTVYGESEVVPQSLENRIGTGTIHIALEEPSFEAGKIREPGESFPKDPQIVNTGNTDVYAFMEVTVPAGIVRTVTQGKASEPSRKDFLEFRPEGSWELLKRQENENDSFYVYGYKEKLKAGKKTSPLFQTMRMIPCLEGTFADGEEIRVRIKAKAAACEGLTEDLSAAYLACLKGLETLEEDDKS